MYFYCHQLWCSRVCRATCDLSCQGGLEVDSCVPNPITDATDRICDGIDGDCDGRVDEGYQNTASTCGLGVCTRSGTVTCVGGRLVDDCEEGNITRIDDQVCDGLDSDCDGRTR